MQWPEGKYFAFSIFDDTDNATIQNVKPVYDLLEELGFRTTKSVWVYPSRGKFTGSCLQDSDYRHWILDIQSAGFEIALHNVGDGQFVRKEILDGIDSFKNLLGQYPRCHTNHESNPDNIYWMEDRFEWPLNYIYRLFRKLHHERPCISAGSDASSPYFWGDVAKRHIRYIRNYTCNETNTLHFDPKMPYRLHRKEAFSNLWFSSSDGHTVKEMNDLLQPEKVDRLEHDRGACIIYTHLASGFVDAKGNLDAVFKQRLQYLSSRGGWFVPVTTLLDHLTEGSTTKDPGYLYRLGRDVLWLKDRLRKRFRYGR